MRPHTWKNFFGQKESGTGGGQTAESEIQQALFSPVKLDFNLFLTGLKQIPREIEFFFVDYGLFVEDG